MVEHMLHIQPTVGVYKVLNMTYIQQINNNSNNINRATLTRVMCTEQTSFFFLFESISKNYYAHLQLILDAVKILWHMLNSSLQPEGAPELQLPDAS